MFRKEITVEELAEALGAEYESVEDLVIGLRPITKSIAKGLAETLGGSCDFWLNRQVQFQSDLKRCAESISTAAAEKFVSRFPIPEMKRRGWIPADLDPLESCLYYFDVSRPEEWEDKYGNLLSAVSFRKSETFPSEFEATLAWLQRGSWLASGINCSDWNPEKFRNSLKEIRALTKKNSPAAFLHRLVDICARSGVALVCSKAPQGCRVSGATRFINKNKALILLSFRYLSDDHFWFTFFHEAGHLLLHDRRALFVEFDSEVDRSHEEDEANQFAQDILIEPEIRNQLFSLKPSTKGIIRAAVKLGVSPGIVVGQMQHAGVIGHHQYNGLKRRYKWSDLPVRA